MIKSSNTYEQNHNAEIVQRFYQAFDSLKQMKIIKNTKNFSERYNINRGNFITVSKNPTSKMFNPCWLSYLVKDYNVSAEWLLTGIGNMLKKQ